MPDLGVFVQYIIDNKEWIFGGVGVLILSAAFNLIRLPFRPKRQSSAVGPSGVPVFAPVPLAENADAVPTHWQGIVPDKSKYKIVTGRSDSIPLGEQTFSFEYGPHGHAKPLTLQGRAVVQADIQFTCRVVNPYKAAFGANEYALNVLQPWFVNAAREVLERYSLTKLRSSREELSNEIVLKLSPKFDELGVHLETVNIGSLEKLA